MTTDDGSAAERDAVIAEFVALVRAVGPAAECTRRSTATDWERCGWCPACRLAVRLDALRTKTEGRDVDVAIAAALERVRLEAIEACIAECERVETVGLVDGATYCAALLRALLDAPKGGR